jgi:lipoate-protein ligase A
MADGGTLPVWWDDAADGGTNMAADEILAAEAIRRGSLVIRLYGWAPACVSLGAFQEIAAARAIPALAGVPLVRRPSGGGAIVHGSDLTYAAAVPKCHPWGGTPQALYDAFHAAMVAELADRGIAARLHPGDAIAPGEAEERFFCFDRRATGDIVASASGKPPAATDPKIMGSAQRRLAGVVLQHGSLLVEANPAVGPEARHAGIEELAPGVSASLPELAAGWLRRVADSCGAAIDWRSGGFRPGREAEIAGCAERFRQDRWTGRR